MIFTSPPTPLQRRGGVLRNGFLFFGEGGGEVIPPKQAFPVMTILVCTYV